MQGIDKGANVLRHMMSLRHHAMRQGKTPLTFTVKGDDWWDLVEHLHERNMPTGFATIYGVPFRVNTRASQTTLDAE